jgi:hypothetical protein
MAGGRPPSACWDASERISIWPAFPKSSTTSGASVIVASGPLNHMGGPRLQHRDQGNVLLPNVTQIGEDSQSVATVGIVRFGGLRIMRERVTASIRLSLPPNRNLMFELFG